MGRWFQGFVKSSAKVENPFVVHHKKTVEHLFSCAANNTCSFEKNIAFDAASFEDSLNDYSQKNFLHRDSMYDLTQWHAGRCICGASPIILLGSGFLRGGVGCLREPTPPLKTPELSTLGRT
ncbi:MAG: hypothetical protein R2825_22990 [Saprospiraceae bacterium]